MDISLTKLRYLVAIANAQSYSRAAEDLRISQPALSRTVAALEARYGVAIFERGRTGARLTTTGAQIVAEVEALLRNADDLDHNLKLYGRGEVGQLSLGLGPHVASLFLPNIARHIMTAKPRVKLQTLARPPEILMQELVNNRIDLFISPDYHDDVPPEIETRVLGSVAVDLVVRASHPLAANGEVAFADAALWPFATTSDSRWPGDPGLFICDNYHIMREVVLESDLVWLCARQFVEKDIAEGRVAVLSVPDPPPQLEPTPIVLGRLKGRSCSRFESEIVECFENLLE